MARYQILIGQIVECIAFEFINDKSLRLPIAVSHHKSNINSFQETNVVFSYLKANLIEKAEIPSRHRQFPTRQFL